MTDDTWDGRPDQMVPLYLLVRGRTSPRNTGLDLATQVAALPVDTCRLELEYAEIVRLCADWMSIAEVAAHLHLPLTIARVMVDVLLDQGYLEVGAPAQHTYIDHELLATVLAGLERL